MSKSVGTEPSSYEKKNLPGRGLTKFEKKLVYMTFLQPLLCKFMCVEIEMHLESKVVTVINGLCTIMTC